MPFCLCRCGKIRLFLANWYGHYFLGSLGLLVLTLFQIRYWLMASIPLGLRVGIGAGIGLFIALIGLKIWDW